MGKWSNAAITNIGIELQSKVLSGETIQITAVKSGSGSVEAVDLRSQTAVLDEQQDLQITGIHTKDNVSTLSVLLTNTGLTSGYDLQQIGIYAIDGEEEILFALAQADEPVTIPSEAEMPLYSIAFSFSFINMNDVSLTAIVDPETFVTKAYLEEMYGNVDNTADADKPVSTAQQQAIDNAMGNLNDEMAAILQTLEGYIWTRNFLNYQSLVDSTKAEVTLNDDGSVTITNTTSSVIEIYTEKQYLEIGTYTFSIKSATTGTMWCVGRGDALLGWKTNTGTEGSYTYENKARTTFRMGVRVSANSSLTVFLQGENGDIATEFVKHSPETVAEALARLSSS